MLLAISCAYQRADALGVMERALSGFRLGALRRAFNSLLGLLEGPGDHVMRAIAHMVNAELARALRTWTAQTATWH